MQGGKEKQSYKYVTLLKSSMGELNGVLSVQHQQITDKMQVRTEPDLVSQCYAGIKGNLGKNGNWLLNYLATNFAMLETEF